MRQVTIYSPGIIGSSGIPRNLTIAPDTLRKRIMQNNVEPKVESTCLSLGGMIKATGLEIKHVDSVDPEPGVGYGWPRERKDHYTMKNPSGWFIQSEESTVRRSSEVICE